MKTEQGYLVLADISGFDAYLAEVELEHAQGVLKELLELLVARLSPPLRLASLEGDAVLSYASGTELGRGETLLELTEATYAAFRDRVKSIHRDNSCNCRACNQIPSLDLKFLVHYGEYLAQATGEGGIELGGLDAKLVRDRLLKDQANGRRAYALFTEPSLAQMGLRPEGMRGNSGSYPHLGEIRTASVDLRSRYEVLTAARRAFVSAEEADLVITHDLDEPVQLVWEWLNDPEKRTKWMKWRKWSAALRPGGRMGIGARNHCAHGLGEIIETVLDWRPYEYFTVELRQDSLGVALTQTYQLDTLPKGGGTQMRVHTRLEKAVSTTLARPILKLGVARLWKNDYETLAHLMAEEGGKPGSA